MAGMPKQPLTCRLLRLIGLHRCYLEHVGIEDNRGVYLCHCGYRMLGLREPIVIPPGGTVTIDLLINQRKNT